MIHIITNGTIKNEKIKNSLIKFLNYSDTIQSDRENILDYFKDKLGDNIFKSSEKKDSAIGMVLSTYEHDNKKTFSNVWDFYNEIKAPKFTLVSQNELKNIQLDIEGRAEHNYKQYSYDELKKCRLIHNKYCLIYDVNGDECIIKCLSVSANGNVYVGCAMSYEHIDQNYLFNIMDCKKNFYDKVDLWSWEHPISKFSNVFIEMYKTYMWQKEHNIKVINQNIDNIMNVVYGQIEVYEQTLKEYHKQLPHLNHFELNMFVVAIIYVMASENGNDEKSLKPFVQYTTGLSEEIIKNITKESMGIMMQKYININNDRAVNSIKNPFLKVMASIYANM